MRDLGLDFSFEMLDAEPTPKPATITVIVEGGVIRDIEDIPDGVRVIVRDYDMDGMDEEYIEKGEGFWESVWG